jgi:single-stranded DNA-binding protein
VRGRLRTREYEKDGQVHRIAEVEATSIGPDLARCSAMVLRRDGEPAGESDGGRVQVSGEVPGGLDQRELGSRAEAAVGA